MSPGSAVFQLWGLREATSLPKASVSSTTAQGPCPEFPGLWWGLREHAEPGKVCMCSPFNSYQNFVISTVPGMVPSLSLLFPSSQRLQNATWGSAGHCPLAFTCGCPAPANCSSQAPLPTGFSLGGPMGSAGRGLGDGRNQGISPPVPLLSGGRVSFFQH